MQQIGVLSARSLNPENFFLNRKALYQIAVIAHFLKRDKERRLCITGGFPGSKGMIQAEIMRDYFMQAHPPLEGRVWIVASGSDELVEAIISLFKEIEQRKIEDEMAFIPASQPTRYYQVHPPVSGSKYECTAHVNQEPVQLLDQGVQLLGKCVRRIVPRPWLRTTQVGG